MERTSIALAGRELRGLPSPSSPARTHHPSARSWPSFCYKTVCTSKCFWPSVRHRQRFPISLISLTLIYFKILHRKKKPSTKQFLYRVSSQTHQGEERLIPNPTSFGSSSASTRSPCIPQETAQPPTQRSVPGRSYQRHKPVPVLRGP